MPADLIMAAWTEYGNALRIAGRYDEADRALKKVEAEPASDPHTRAHFLEVKATLYRWTRRFEGAVEFLHSAIEIQRSIGNSDGEARHYNHLGIIHLDSGDMPQALRSYQAALDLYGPDSPADLVVMTSHNMLEALIASGRPTAAATALAVLERFYQNITSTRLAAKAEWARAKLCREFGQFDAAKLAFERTHALLKKEPRAPELPALMDEIAELEILIKRAAAAQKPGD
jgi:tetratricopeptide (TPR) repeat protein